MEQNKPEEQWGQQKITSNTDTLLNNSGTIENKQTGNKFKVQAGKPTDSNVIYAAECTKCKVIYVGQTGGKVSTRMSGHRSDVKHYPERCEFPKHFSDNGCNFETDLRVTILEHVKGGEGTRLQKDAVWMTRLQSITPNGLNARSSEFASVSKALYGE